MYGFPALRYTLLEEEGSSLTEKDLGLVFTIGAGGNLCASFVVGLLRDRIGTRNAVQFAIILVICGSLGLAFCSPNSAWQLCVSLVFMELGSGAQICVLPVAELFDNPGAVLGLLSGAFNVSALLFPLLFTISTDRRIGAGGYATIVGVLGVVGYLLLPRGLSFHNEESSIDGDKPEFPVKNSTTSEKKTDIDGIQTYPLRKSTDCKEELLIGSEDFLPSNIDETGIEKTSPSTMQQIKSVEYICVLAWFTISVLPLQYYAGTLGWQLNAKGDVDGKYASLFAIFLAVSPALSPFVGFISDHFGVGFAQGIGTLMTSIPFILLMTDGLSIQVLGMVCYTLGRMLVFTMFFSNIGARFGYDNIGTLVGIGAVTSASLSFVQYPMISVASLGYLTLVNIVCAAVMMCLLPYCIWLGCKEVSEWRALRETGTEPPIRKATIRNVARLSLAGSVIAIRATDTANSHRRSSTSHRGSIFSSKKYSSVVLVRQTRNYTSTSISNHIEDG